ncbi:MoxR family ATPase [Thermomicrobium sp. CFH 73360]|uniref:AAA family ATPase n=1 Tax=Thermomicrobium sp. CFH 73360 TaxID=2951987 RepID=UPI002077746F|nr:MoxR family ATPase [Thermomicrobium sp. CFH 73360]MCM8746981.1 MoxR family ATPase [Thermomicrobium sp. CFH 73360]
MISLNDAPRERLSSDRVDALQELLLRVRNAVERVIVGKRDVIELLLVAVLSGGHVLVEDVPGIGKTKLGKSFCQAIGGTFRRIQFTPDLLPADVTGSLVYEPGRGSFVFHPGPIFANVVLADEVNRGTPRTQSALLEAMEERQVTVERETYRLPEPFLVLATQNPIELEGTFPLPEAQLDRFAMRLSVGYPAAEDEVAMVRRFLGGDPLVELEPVTRPEELAAAIAETKRVFLGQATLDYLVSLVRRTREHEEVQLGASPRATLALARAAQAAALLSGRPFVIPDDVRRVAIPVLAHRLRLVPRAELHGLTAEALIRAILDEVPVPVEEVAEGV